VTCCELIIFQHSLTARTSKVVRNLRFQSPDWHDCV